jgi:glycosyltransferase involved in cell wall biosynthesis
MGIATVMSGVGVNNQIIKDGVNGFLANSIEEWVEKLSTLIEDAALRVQFGEEGRKTVLVDYSYESQKERYLFYFNELTRK